MFVVKEVRPGVVHLMEDEHPSGVLIFVRTLALFCKDCGKACVPKTQPNEFNYMIDEALWKKHVPEDGILCMRCFEKRMDRALELREFRIFAV